MRHLKPLDIHSQRQLIRALQGKGQRDRYTLLSPRLLTEREDRLATIAAAKQRLQEQARAEAEAERLRRQEAEAERQRRGQKRRGKEPGPIVETPDDKAQTNFTDPGLKIMKANNKGWDYCGNAQATVDEAFQIIVACDVSAAANDKQQAVPLAQATLENLHSAGIALPTDETGEVQKIPATPASGYYSETAAQELENLGFDPHIATGRQRHGATRLLPGSHRTCKRLPNRMLQPESPHTDAQVVIARAGSVLLFNSHLIHSGTRNKVGRPRRALHCKFVARDLVLPFYTQPDIPARFRPAAQYILGG